MYVDAQHISQPLKHPMLATTTDDDVLQQARRGVPDAFAAILREHESRVYSIALRFTGRRSDAEELTQDVFLQLHGALGRMVDSTHLKRWLLRTVTHRCLNRLRDESRRPKLVPIEALESGSEPQSVDREADPLLGARLRQLLLELPADARAVLLLRFQEDLDPSGIASVLEMPVNTVKSHLRRSLDWLRAQCAGENHGY
jgi:RNA polymerase sigma-70 factor, ECF subfamily